MGQTTLQGILPVLPTPFKEDGSVDISAMERVTQFCIDSGANGLVFPGVASEYDHLEADEQFTLLEAISRLAAGRVPVICGGGKGGPDKIGSNILRARESGVVAAMVLIPKKYAGDPEGAQQFITAVIENAQGVDIILQNAPAPVGADLEANELSLIVNSSPAIRYVKEEGLPSGPRITAISDAAPDHLLGVIGGGGARYLIDEMNRGAIAAMPAAEITDLHVKMWNAYQNGDEPEARLLYMKTLPLLIIQLLYRMHLTKYVLTQRGVLSNAFVRAPLPMFDSFDESELHSQLDSLSDLFEIAPMKSLKVEV